ncbi:hypothetical protein D5F20_19745 [Shigella dysenteriae]|nr:hypothetical protein [Shigella dysenteriae]
MHSWKKKLVVSQLALACTLAITSQANAANYDTWGYHDNTTTDLVWPYDTDNDGIAGNDSNLLIVFYVQIMPDDFVMQLHRF